MTFILFPVIVIDGKDGNGLKFENFGPTFSSFDAISKNTKKLIIGCSS